ncbi:hypothetical protein B7R21_06300 [Subtercola boreus]|uniref:Uncharacterized protein n=1 Tax=Subtercola boreus TaxID=120213 RepID=A0A3E0VZ34_9MICO|nr:hypothetical protein [Subtercola boreus]RFA14553.1 hypothetical protein B7R21_06300 [Subtercola boreus]
MIARINGLVFDGGAGTDGFYVSEDGFTGWDSTPDIRRDEAQKPLAAGSFDAVGYFSSRVISISGLCFADSPEKLFYYQQRLSGLLAGPEPAHLVVDQAGLTTSASVRLASKTQFQVTLWGVQASYQIQFWAADPRKYGESHTFTADPATPLVVSAWQYGNFAAYPVLTITGSMPSYSVSSGGKTYQVNKSVTAGHPHQIFMDSGLLIVDGFPVYGVVEQAGIWAVPPGQTISQTLAPSGGTGVMTVTVADTYI